MLDVKTLGQVFTSPEIVDQMLALRKNYGSVLEPACGDGAFSNLLDGNCTAIELDETKAPENALRMDFFDFPIEHQFDTVIGNPPYVRFQDILPSTKSKLDLKLFDGRSNLYLFFIEKCIRQLKPHGELIFITPRDFLKATSAIKLNQFIYNQGTITDLIELGDERVFVGFNPNCVIWRFEKNNFSRITNGTEQFQCSNGQLLFTDEIYPVKFSDIFFVKVGAVSGADDVFTHEKLGNIDFVCSETARTGKTRRMIFNKTCSYLNEFKQRLIERRIKPFDESNWWTWGRGYYLSNRPRIYVNSKTRNANPFFIHDSIHYDGSVLAIFPRDENADVQLLARLLNQVNWEELGFVCDGRFIFSQKSLENTILPKSFLNFINSDQQLAESA